MGAAASTRMGAAFVKVELLPSVPVELTGRAPEQGTEIRVDDVAVLMGCPSKVLEEAQRTGVPPACALADDFEHHFVQPSHGGSTPLRAVARHPFADKSHSHLLIARGIPTSQHGASSASSSSTSEAPDAATNNRSTNSNYNGASSSSSSSTVTSASTGSAVSSGGAPFYLVPRLEPFSRISGICTLLGDRETPSNELHALTVGDFIRIGSVGLVVTEARVSPAAPVVSITAEQLWHLKPRAYAAVAPPAAGSSDRPRVGAAVVSPSKQPPSYRKPWLEEAKGDDDDDQEEEGSAAAATAGQRSPSSRCSTRRRRSDRQVRCPNGLPDELHDQLGGVGADCEDDDDDDEDSGLWATESEAEEGSAAGHGLGGGGSSSKRRSLPSPPSSANREGSAGGEEEEEEEEDVPLCYVCCDDAEVGPENPLVSACVCIGGTRWLHLRCLNRLLSGGTSPHGSNQQAATPCVMFRNQNRNFICKVCRSEYSTHCELRGSTNPDGTPVMVPIPQPSLRPPYICFKVVTHNAHNSIADSIFNSTFHVSFAGLVDQAALQEAAASPSSPQAAGAAAAGAAAAEASHSPSPSVLPPARRALVIGRSVEADMQLNYQTVSGHHAALHFSGNGFQISDLRSSNGTFLYLREPFKLVPGQPVRVRMGRKTLRITAHSPSSALSAATAAASAAANAAASSLRRSTNHSSASTAAASADTTSGRVPPSLLNGVVDHLLQGECEGRARDSEATVTTTNVTTTNGNHSKAATSTVGGAPHSASSVAVATPPPAVPVAALLALMVTPPPPSPLRVRGGGYASADDSPQDNTPSPTNESPTRDSAPAVMPPLAEAESTMTSSRYGAVTAQSAVIHASAAAADMEDAIGNNNRDGTESILEGTTAGAKEASEEVTETSPREEAKPVAVSPSRLARRQVPGWRQEEERKDEEKKGEEVLASETGSTAVPVPLVPARVDDFSGSASEGKQDSQDGGKEEGSEKQEARAAQRQTQVAAAAAAAEPLYSQPAVEKEMKEVYEVIAQQRDRKARSVAEATRELADSTLEEERGVAM